MKRNPIILIAIFIAVAHPQAQTAAGGRFDARSLVGGAADFVVSLDGEWDFWPGVALEPGELGEEGKTAAWVPSTWNLSGYPARSSGTYRLALELPEGNRWALLLDDVDSSFVIWADGVEIARSGDPFDPGLAASPERWLRSVPFEDPDGDGRVEIVIAVSNRILTTAGMVRRLGFGSFDAVAREYLSRIGIDYALLGAVMMMSLYHVILYLLVRKDRSYFWIAIAAIAVGARTVITGNRVLYGFFPGFPQELSFKLEILTLCAIFPFMMFFRSLYREHFGKIVAIVSGVGVAAFGACVLVLPADVGALLLPPFEIFMVATMLAAMAYLVRCAIKRDRDVASIFVAVAFVLGCIVNDSLKGNGLVHTPFLTPYGLLAFFLVQSYILAKRFARSLDASERMTGELRAKSEAFARFVPKEFLAYLGRPAIEDVRLGDQREFRMSVMFSDIIAFTALAEAMTPEETFEYLNSYLALNAPVVSRHGGFVDKFIGDSIMAIFPGGADAALDAAVEMQRNVPPFNGSRQSGLPSLRIGIGLHFGDLIMGTIGQHDRLETTVISDAVNAASRLESLTRHYGCRVLASHEFVSQLEAGRARPCREIDVARVKGKKEPIRIFQMIEGEEAGRIPAYASTAAAFAEGIAAYRAMLMSDAISAFRRVLSIDPADQIARLYVDRCDRLLASGIPDRWDAIVDFEFK
jgi:class 3 adenylate cyclase